MFPNFKVNLTRQERMTFTKACLLNSFLKNVLRKLFQEKLTINPLMKEGNKCIECRDTEVYMDLEHTQSDKIHIARQHLLSFLREVRSSDVKLRM